MIAPRETDMEARALETLARIVVEDARAAAGRVEDRAVNASRALIREAEDRIAELDRAARELGRTRGVAVDAAQAKAAHAEVEALRDGAFDALFERFLRRVRLGLDALPKEETRYRAALRSWAEAAAAATDAPAEVFTAKRDRKVVYETLLATSAQDFHVRVDHRIHVGFVVRDLDGRTLFDARPEARIEALRDDLRRQLRAAIPDAPTLEVPPSVGPADVAPIDPLRAPETGSPRLGRERRPPLPTDDPSVSS